MGYTPELLDYHSSTLRRVSWALGKPMTKKIDTLFDSLDRVEEPGKVCERGRDKTHSGFGASFRESSFWMKRPHSGVMIVDDFP